jgi:hypothetical protein
MIKVNNVKFIEELEKRKIERHYTEKEFEEDLLAEKR